MLNVLTFSVVVSLGIIALTWAMNDLLPQILYERKLDNAKKLAEESRRRYWEVRSSEATMTIRIPDRSMTMAGDTLSRD
jgi:hypothetical protein